MREKVLLYIEDEDAAAFLLETALREADIPLQVYRVSDGDQAIAFLHRSGTYESAPKPDLILLDLNLPRRSGLEILAELQSDGDLRSIPAVVFTSSSAPSDQRKSFSLGARQYITKPSSFDGFLGAIRSACSEVFGNGTPA
ncbi:MAG: response regulator [Acidobacteriaceae bacterium]|nr:response regulator [Acidobacteriaceae bacterium]